MINHKLFVYSFLMLWGATAAHKPKTLSRDADPSQPLGPPEAEGVTTLTSKSATQLGDCQPGKPFHIELAGEAGRGVIGAPESQVTGIDITFAETSANDDQIDITGESEPNFFALESTLTGDEDFWGLPFQYKIVGSPGNGEEGYGRVAVITCVEETPIIVLISDDSGYEIEATVTEKDNGDEEIALTGGIEAVEPLQGKTRAKKGQAESPVSFDESTKKSIIVRRQQGNPNKGIALVNAKVTDSKGKTVVRTFVHESKEKSGKKSKNISVKCCDINDDGDVEIHFPSLSAKHEFYRVDARLGLTIPSVSQEPEALVDVTAMISEDGKMQVHGGWIRRALEAHGMEGQDNGWDIEIMDAIVTDPASNYKVVGRMGNVIGNKIPPGQAKKRSALSIAPTEEEKSVSSEMKISRKPDKQSGFNRRRLSGNHKKILVHGYCASANPFPIGQFDNATAFSDPDTTNPTASNWSHDEFARKIDHFADSQGIHGCGIIAHSQGGAAALHLYTYYWSCLDYSTSGSRMIQSVGTPYQGTSLAGSLAAIGDIFGAGCGTNDDLTYSGASTWLWGIPSWAKSKVHYFTTSFTDKWWRYDYCHLATDLLLGDPEDGTTEKSKGQLSGATNRGHKAGYCHSSGMRDPPQTQDSSRNADMNANAKY